MPYRVPVLVYFPMLWPRQVAGLKICSLQTLSPDARVQLQPLQRPSSGPWFNVGTEYMESIDLSFVYFYFCFPIITLLISFPFSLTSCFPSTSHGLHTRPLPHQAECGNYNRWISYRGGFIFCNDYSHTSSALCYGSRSLTTIASAPSSLQPRLPSRQQPRLPHIRELNCSS